jgi:hypothetical protein
MRTLNARNPHYKELTRDPRNYKSPYSFHEYPKYIELPDGSSVTVDNVAEEQAARGEVEPQSEAQSETQPEAASTQSSDLVANAAARRRQAKVDAQS